MKFRKFGKALLMSAISAGAVLSVTSCVQSYSVGFLYVTGTTTAQTTGNGIISGFKIDHNTGKLNAINGMPISSGGANPVRAVLLSGARFLYVLNRGVDPSGGDCKSAATPCTGSNIVQFSVGGNGILTAQETFYTEGNNPFRIFADSSGSFLYVLDHDAPPDAGSTTSAACMSQFGTPNCGDISAFKVDPATGRLSHLLNAQVTSSSGQQLAYFPVQANPIDVILASSEVLTLSGTPATGDTVFPYAFSQGNGQLSISQNSLQALNINQATAIQYGDGDVYILDNEPLTIATGAPGTVFPAGTYPSQIIPYTVGAGGALQAATGGPVPIDVTETNPLFLLPESKGKWVYVAAEGNLAITPNALSGITGYVIDTSTHQLTPMSGSPFGTGAGPQCLVEDPSDQFLYTANFNDSTVTGRVIDQNSGVLSHLPGTANKPYAVNGPATYCLVDGRTS